MDEALKAEICALVNQTLDQRFASTPEWKLRIELHAMREIGRKSRREAGLRLKAWRESQGLTQLQVAKRIGVSRQYVDKWESGEEVISVALMHRMDDALGIEMLALPEAPPLPVEGK